MIIKGFPFFFSDFSELAMPVDLIDGTGTQDIDFFFCKAKKIVYQRFVFGISEPLPLIP